MTDREKLIGLLTDSFDAQYNQRQLITPVHTADHLLANGVTFAKDTDVPSKWISVEDRLPECKQDVLMYFGTGNMAVGWWYDRDEAITFWRAYSDDGWCTDCDCEPLLWMPLPEPPENNE